MSRSPRTADLGYDPENGTDHDHAEPVAPADGFGRADTGYRPEYDPGRLDPPTNPNLPIVPAHPDAGMQEATTSIFAAVPARAGRDDSAEHAWADPWADHARADPTWADPTRADSAWADPTWGDRSWDRPDYDDGTDGLDEFDRFGGFDGSGGLDTGAPDPAGEGSLDGPDVVDAPGRSGTRLAALLVPVVVGVAISVGLGVYARVHEGTGTAINLAGFSSGLAAKSWLTAAAFVLVLVQLWTSMRMYGRIGRNRPAGPRTATVHRWAGRLAVLVTIPVAVHCLYALGFSEANLRVLVHSLLGCFFYGAFAAKMLVLPRGDAPRWALPVLGGLVFTVLTGLFLTSSVWFFTTKGLTF
ncbi:DUF6529 family protein [Pseudonocardia kujensis]|uniref:DUF6529 family protein n=1 Tax=Pseudonocardia kujensis TaxID=1128675 RepID=UPI001E525020|nr:DUF6529 family protein [Pseudonocardia kujensis]MCE0762320.1 DUF6529 family protein [Pseudonocardia kujensis]